MPYVKAYSQVVQAELEPTAWDETYFSLMSLKAQMQSLPGWQSFDLWVRPEEAGRLHLLAVTNWSLLDQLEGWLQSNRTVDAILRAMNPPPRVLEATVYEVVL